MARVPSLAVRVGEEEVRMVLGFNQGSVGRRERRGEGVGEGVGSIQRGRAGARGGARARNEGGGGKRRGEGETGGSVSTGVR